MAFAVTSVALRSGLRAVLAAGAAGLPIATFHRFDIESWFDGWSSWLGMALAVLVAESLAYQGELTRVRSRYFWSCMALGFAAFWPEFVLAVNGALGLVAGGMSSVLVREPRERVERELATETESKAIENLKSRVVWLNWCLWLAAGGMLWILVIVFQIEDAMGAGLMLAFVASPVKVVGLPALALWLSNAQHRDTPWKWGIVPAIAMLVYSPLLLRGVMPAFGVY